MISTILSVCANPLQQRNDRLFYLSVFFQITNAMSRQFLILLVFFLAVQFIGSRARNLGERGSSDHEINVHKRVSRQIAPGTKWCGNGDKAADDKDLGYFRETDKCCREHDKCPMNMKGKETKYGLNNPDMFTRSHCDCDKKFFECLTDAPSRFSRTIGELYFNFLGKKCFREKICPADETCEKSYEWVDGKAWLPTLDELRKMYQMISILIPELEIDPFEDYIIGISIGDASNHTNSSSIVLRS